MSSITRLSLIAAVAGALIASPALAQGKGNNKANDRANASSDRRGADRPELIRRGDIWEVQQRGSQNSRGGVQQGPAFCRSGAGHPVHGRRWCEDRGYGIYNSRYDSRVNDRDRRGSNSYDAAHAEFHRRHDAQCRARAAERPLDLQHQARVRSECRQQHDEWHRRAGRSH